MLLASAPREQHRPKKLSGDDAKMGLKLSLSGAAASLVLALAVSPPALAQTQLNGSALGHIEAVVSFCSEAAPQQAAKYAQRLKDATSNASAADIAKARKTKEYEEARDAVREELARMPKEKAGEACRSALDS